MGYPETSVTNYQSKLRNILNSEDLIYTAAVAWNYALVKTVIRVGNEYCTVLPA